MHNNRYLPLTGLLTYFLLPEKNIVKFLKYFTPKNHEILHHYLYVMTAIYVGELADSEVADVTR